MSEGKRRVLVTGAASGIGFELAATLAGEGHDIVLSDRDAAGLEAARRRLSSEADATAVAGDLTDAAAIERLAGEVGAVDGLVNCAGIYPVTPLLELSADEWDRVLSLNLRAPFLLTKAVARQMIAAGRGGSVVNISSTASVLARPGIAHYGTSKAGLNQLTRVMAIELAPHAIRVNAILPGVIGTATVEASLTTNEAKAEMSAKLARIPMGRLGTPLEIAKLACFLLSDASSYSTGGLFTADGGFSLGMARY